MFQIAVDGEARLRDQADELPGPHAALRQPAPQLPRASRPVRRGRRRSTATSSPGRCTGSLRVRHVTQDDAHIFCTREQIEDEIYGCLDYVAFLYDALRHASRAPSSRPAPTTSSAPTTSGTSPRERSSGARAARDRVLRRRGRGRVLRAEDRPPHGPTRSVAPGRWGRSSSTRRCRRGSGSRTWAPTTTSTRRLRRPSRALRLARALHRDPDRALRRRVPGLARAGAGARPPGRGGSPRGGAASSSRALALAGVRADVDERDETLGKRIRDAELAEDPVRRRVGRPRDARGDGRAQARRRGRRRRCRSTRSSTRSPSRARCQWSLATAHPDAATLRALQSRSGIAPHLAGRRAARGSTESDPTRECRRCMQWRFHE